MKNLNFFTKVNFINSKKEKNIIDGNFSVKKGKNKIAGIFDYKNKEFVIKKSNIRNTFIDGKLSGEINFSPYFDYNLDLSLNSMNFTKLSASARVGLAFGLVCSATWREILLSWNDLTIVAVLSVDALSRTCTTKFV